MKKVDTLLSVFFMMISKSEYLSSRWKVRVGRGSFLGIMSFSGTVTMGYMSPMLEV